MKFVIVTGMSGAGKSTALHALEDSEFYCVDNLPIRLIRPFAQLANDGSSSEFTKFAVGIDVRSMAAKQDFPEAISALMEAGIKYDLLFLDSSDEALLRRYKETRRTHPLAGKTGSVEEAIAEERKKLAFMKERADCIIDTSKLLVRDLRQELIRIFVQDREYRNLYITVQSFGFKYGIPADSDLVMDVRFLPNPFYVDSIRNLTGKDQPIIDFVMSSQGSGEFIGKYTDLLNFLIPNYIAEGKNQLVISVGCTGGRHRSVVLAEEIGKRLLKDTDCGVRVEHRDIDRDTARR